MYKYVDKVLSHIEGNKSKKIIEYELFDHIDEHQKFFEEIGYNEETAIEKSEEKMGDADIVGEQFNSIKKHYYIFDYVIMVLASVLSYLYYHFTALDNSIKDMSFGMQPYLMAPKFYGTIVGFIGIIIGLLYIVRGIKRKNILFATFGYLYSSLMLAFAPKEWLEGINSDYISYFFESYYSDTSGVISIDLSPKQIVFFLLLLVIFSVFYILALSNIIRTKKLKNTKRDLRLGKAVSIILCVLVLVFVFLGSLITVKAYSYKSETEQIAKAELAEMNEFIIDNANSLVNMSYDEATELFKNKFGDDFKKNDGAYESESAFTGFSCYENEYLSVYTYSDYINPFDFINEQWNFRSNLYSFDNENSLSKNTDIKDMSALCGLEIDNNCLIFDYGFEKGTVKFSYDKKTDDFVLQFSSSFDYPKTVNLTKEQKLMLENILNSDEYMFYGKYLDNYFTVSISDLGDSYDKLIETTNILNDVHTDVCTKIFDARYNENFDLYKITLYSFKYQFAPRSGIYSQIAYSDISPVSNYYVKLVDGEAEIVNIEPNDDIEANPNESDITKLIIENIKAKY